MRETSIAIPPDEFAARAGRLRDYLEQEGLSGAVLFDSFHILYFTGYAFIATERPIAFLLNARGERALFVPDLELGRAEGEAAVDRVHSYGEYPSEPHPMELLRLPLRDLKIAGRVGADSDGYPWVFGYRGPSLSALLDAQVTAISGFVEDLMAIKSSAEIALIRESCTWANLAHRLLQRYTSVGASENEIGMRATSEATIAMLAALGHLYRSQSVYFDGAIAAYHGQVGRNAAVPHTMASNITLRAGDVLISDALSVVWGYHSELERTLIVGEPAPQQRALFEHMTAAQEIAFDAIRPGRECAEVDRAVRAYYEEHGLLPYWRHHTGHGIGLRFHEGPFLDRGDHTVIQPGMVFTVEPGLYAPALGGFRHSDTVVVTQDGIERLTYYARDLESLTVPA